MSVKVFTIAEANRIIPVVDESVRVFKSLSAEVVQAQDSLAVLQVLGADVPGSPEHGDFLSKRARLEELAREFNERLEDFNRLGCLLKDLEHGLVDFYGLKGGRLIFLCWRLGEGEILYWHEIDTGFSGRRPLAELESADG